MDIFSCCIGFQDKSNPCFWGSMMNKLTCVLLLWLLLLPSPQLPRPLWFLKLNISGTRYQHCENFNVILNAIIIWLIGSCYLYVHIFQKELNLEKIRHVQLWELVSNSMVDKNVIVLIIKLVVHIFFINIFDLYLLKWSVATMQTSTAANVNRKRIS